MPKVSLANQWCFKGLADRTKSVNPWIITPCIYVCRTFNGSLCTKLCYVIYKVVQFSRSRSQWPHGLRCRSAAARLQRSWVRIPPEEWLLVCCECCVLSGRSLCDEPITRPEESYRLWCVVVCDLETSRMRRPWNALDRSATEKKGFPVTGLVWPRGSAARPGRTLPPGKTRYPFYRRLGGTQGRSGRAEILVPNGIRSRTIQPVVSRYTLRKYSQLTLTMKIPLRKLDKT